MDSLYAAYGSVIETVFRQPLMAITSVMVIEKVGINDAALKIYLKGGISHFYNGFEGFSIAAIQRIIHRVLTFETYRILYQNNYNLLQISVINSCIETSVTMIGEMFLTVAQIQTGNLTPRQIFHERIKQNGYKTLTVGLIATLARNTTFNFSYFGSNYYFPYYVEKYPFTTAFISAVNGVIIRFFLF
jgi:hypothetical protein